MKYLLITISALLLLSACRGPEGPIGPRGESGNLYDYKTFVYTIAPEDWTEYENGEGLFYDVSAPEITYDILDYGFFITYLNTGTQKKPVYYEMPQTLVKTDNNGVTYSEELYPSYSKDIVRIEYYDTHPIEKFLPASSYSFRTVIISDPYIETQIRAKKLSTDYNSVMNAIQERQNNYTKNNLQ